MPGRHSTVMYGGPPWDNTFPVTPVTPPTFPNPTYPGLPAIPSPWDVLPFIPTPQPLPGALPAFPSLTMRPCTTCSRLHFGDVCPFCLRKTLERMEESAGRFEAQLTELIAGFHKVQQQMHALLTLTTTTVKAKKKKPSKTKTKTKKAKKK